MGCVTLHSKEYDDTMLKKFLRYASAVCFRLGLSGLSAFLWEHTEHEDDYKEVELPKKGVSEHINAYALEVVYEDKELVAELGSRRTNDIKLAKNVYDVN